MWVWGSINLRFSTCMLLAPCSLASSLSHSFLYNNVILRLWLLHDNPYHTLRHYSNRQTVPAILIPDAYTSSRLQGPLRFIQTC
jgi:hypothetical protein